jgi:membrane-associated phospholipid phosphatase
LAFPVAPSPGSGAPGWRAAEIFLGSYAAIVTIIALTRLDLTRGNWLIALAHALIIVWLWLVTRPGLGPTGRLLREIMPLIIVLAGYAALDVLSGGGQLRAHDRVLLGWEEAAFGMQPARDWWRGHTSPFWSTLLHGVYFFYYLILALPALFFLLQGDWPAFRRLTRNVVCTFCVCFLVFVLYPVAGPYYVFEHPTGLMVDNLPAHLVYAALASGSSFGAAFPSSHVAAATAAELATFRGNRTLGWILLLPVILMPIATVYTQMHYAWDAIAGVLVGILVPWIAGRIEGTA